MCSNRVWHPEKSIVLHGGGEEMEGGRGSVIEEPQATSTPVRKRKVPTVDTRGASTRISSSKCKGSTEPERGGQSYDTIEQTRRDSAILECKSLQQAKACADFCGWLENERLSNHASDRRRLGSTSDRVSLQTPAEGCRSTLQSRVGRRYSSSVYGRRHQYEFRHLLDSHEYIEQYRKMYCYTTLTIPPQQEHSIAEGTPISKEQDVQQVESFLPLGVKSLHRGDPYLRELASRLGVRESIKEQQLLRSPRPTPPSITKGNRNTEDLVIHANGKKEEDISSEKISTENVSYKEKERHYTNSTLFQNSPKASRPVSRSVHPKEGKWTTPLELPNIAQPHKKSTSVISVAKYLQVTSHTQPNQLPESEISKAENANSNHSLVQVATSTTVSEESIPEHIHDATSDEDLPAGNQEVKFPPKNARFSLQEQLPLLDENEKERLISRKAHALGLLSRDWAKAPHVRRMIGNYKQGNTPDDYPYTRPATRGVPSRAEATNEEKTKLIHMSDQKKEDSISRPKASRDRSPDKLEKLRSIYEPSRSHSKRRKESHQRMHSAKNHRCESRAARLDREHERHSHSERNFHSRPVTRLSSPEKLGVRTCFPKAVVKEVDMEDDSCSTYWSEVPRKTETRTLSKHDTHNYNLLVDSKDKRDSRDGYNYSRPVTRNSSKLQHHTIALAMKLGRPPKPKKRTSIEDNGFCEVIPPGSSSRQISTHIARMRKRFEGLLDVKLLHQ